MDRIGEQGVGPFSIIKWVRFRLSKIKPITQSGSVFDYKVGLFSIDKNKFNPIPGNTRELDLKRIAIRTNSPDLNGLTWRYWLDRNRFGCEVEGNPQDIGVLNIKQWF